MHGYGPAYAWFVKENYVLQKYKTILKFRGSYVTLLSNTLLSKNVYVSCMYRVFLEPIVYVL